MSLTQQYLVSVVIIADATINFAAATTSMRQPSGSPTAAMIN